LETGWRPYPGVVIDRGEDCTRIAAPWLAGEVVLQDMLEAQPDGGFVVLGRNSDMVEVGGKRASLADLTRRYRVDPGVMDAVVFQPDATVGAVVQRLAALAVVEGLTEAELLARLAPLVDPVFLAASAGVGAAPAAQRVGQVAARAAAGGPATPLASRGQRKRPQPHCTTSISINRSDRQMSAARIRVGTFAPRCSRSARSTRAASCRLRK